MTAVHHLTAEFFAPLRGYQAPPLRLSYFDGTRWNTAGLFHTKAEAQAWAAEHHAGQPTRITNA